MNAEKKLGERFVYWIVLFLHITYIHALYAKQRRRRTIHHAIEKQVRLPQIAIGTFSDQHRLSISTG